MKHGELSWVQRWHCLSMAALAALLCLGLASCAAKEAYRHDTAQLCDETQNKCDTSALVKTKEGFILGFVEIDDQGIFFDNRMDKSQQRSILNYLEKKENLYVVVFIHGWHHSAAPEDGSIDSFRRRLGDAKRRLPGKEVVGIYIGWRGDSIDVPYLNTATFWDRKNTSEEVGRNALVGFLLELELIKANKEHKNALVLTGHSFGASALYNAVHQTLLQRLIQAETEPGVDAVRGFGDLVVLINPAIEAMRFSPLYDASQAHARRRGFEPMQPVRLIVAATPGDWAATTLFPIGRWLSTSLEFHRVYLPPQHRRRTDELEVDQAEMDRTTMGQFKPYQTHKLGMSHRRDGNECQVKEGWLRESVQRKIARSIQDRTSPVNGEGWISKGEGWNSLGQTGIPKQMQIEHLVGQSHPYSPYWVVKLDETTIMRDHNNISGLNFWCFIDLVLLKESSARSDSAPALPAPTGAPLSEPVTSDQ
ncbi:MAG: hypothetical protein KAF64_14890 [Hydrogenophaga sp.]|uniref:hypothetical protein n=1 Tax=Hydrogenophaga sp. TaxID=1904254 RepID=UPI0025C5E660|nr:hypothetical protein [Hydrogenophaga sp.]MBU7574640.1 hypothetical protein [Hydrogenophaga sp.]